MSIKDIRRWASMASARHRHYHTRRLSKSGISVYGSGDCLLTHPTNAAAAASFAQVGCKVALRSPCQATIHTSLLIGISAFCLLLLSACSLFGGGSTATIPSAQDLLHNAQAAIMKVTAYHFNLVAQNPGSGGLLTITSADGDILIPDKLKADAKALVLNNTVAVKIVAIGNKQYITDPITGQWTSTSGLLDPRTLADPQNGVAAIISHIQNPSTPKDSTVDGTACWSIDGTLDTKYLSGITGVSSNGGKTVAVTTCIGKSDNLPYLIRINGVAVQGDTDKTTRTFKLSKFNEQVTITAPI